MKFTYCGKSAVVTLDALGVTVTRGDAVDVPAERVDEFTERPDFERVETRKKAAVKAAPEAEEAD